MVLLRVVILPLLWVSPGWAQSSSSGSSSSSGGGDSSAPSTEHPGSGAGSSSAALPYERLIRVATEAAQLTSAGELAAAEQKLVELLGHVPVDHWQHAWLRIQLAQLRQVGDPAAWRQLQPLAESLLEVLASDADDRFAAHMAARAVLQLVDLVGSSDDRPAQLALLDRLIAQGCPDHCRAATLLRRGQLLLLEGDPDAARFDLQQLLELPGRSEAEMLLGRYLLAESLYQVAAWDEAAEHWRWLVEQGTLEPAAGWLQLAMLRLAEWQISRQRWSEAASLLESLLGDQPLESLAASLPTGVAAEALYLQARSLISQAELESARSYLRAAESQLTPAQITQASRIGWLIGETYLLQGDYASALSAYWEVLEQADGDPRWRAAAMLQASRCQQALGRPDRAEQLCRRLLEELPASPFTVEAQRWLAELGETKATARLADDRYKEGREAIR